MYITIRMQATGSIQLLWHSPALAVISLYEPVERKSQAPHSYKVHYLCLAYSLHSRYSEKNIILFWEYLLLPFWHTFSTDMYSLTHKQGTILAWVQALGSRFPLLWHPFWGRTVFIRSMATAQITPFPHGPGNSVLHLEPEWIDELQILKRYVPWQMICEKELEGVP